MERASIFVDTSGLFALLNEDDAYHRQAQALMLRLGEQGARVVTSDWVVAELLGLASGRRFRRIGAALVRDMFENPRVEVIPATRDGLQSALILFETRPDKAWSLTDCHSMLVCEKRHIGRVFTADHHFAQAGLTVLLR